MNFIGVLIIYIFLFATSASATDIFLNSNYIKTKGDFTCGYVNGNWVIGKYTNGKFESHKSRIKDINNSLSVSINRQEKKSLRIAKRLLKEELKLGKDVCRSIDNIPIGETINFSDLPSYEEIISTNDENLRQTFYRLSQTSLSGTPPLLNEISEIGAENVFWRSNILNNTSQSNICNEFLGSSEAGTSAGLGSCKIAEAIGSTLKRISRNENELCILKTLDFKAGFSSGGAQLLEGNLPDNDITKIFATPHDKPKIIKVLSEDKIILVKIDDVITNTAQNRLYAHDIKFCSNSPNKIYGHEKFKIAADRTFSAENVIFKNGLFGSKITGKIKNHEIITLDITSPRIIISNYISDTGSKYKNEITVTTENEIILKIHNIEKEDQEINTYKSFSYSDFLGHDISSLRILTGAFKSLDSFNSFQGAFEYKDTFYSSAEENLHKNPVELSNFPNDDFYQTSAQVREDFLNDNCEHEADIILTLDTNNETIKESLSTCRENIYESTNFCKSSDLKQFYYNSCRQ